MFKADNFFGFALVSVMAHVVFIWIVFAPKAKAVFIPMPIEVTFFSPASGGAPVPPAPEPVRRIEDVPRPQTPRTEETIRVKDAERTRPPEPKRPTPAPPAPVTPAPAAPPAPEPVVAAEPAPQTYGIAAPGAAGGSGLSLDTANFRYAFYTNQIVRIIGRNWHHSENFGRQRAVIHFRIARDGSVSNVSVRESSGSSGFDANAMNAVRRSTFPPLPESFDESSLGVYFEFKHQHRM